MTSNATSALSVGYRGPPNTTTRLTVDLGWRALAGGVSLGLRDLDAKSLRGVREASVVAVQAFEVLAQAHDGCQVQGVE